MVSEVTRESKLKAPTLTLTLFQVTPPSLDWYISPLARPSSVSRFFLRVAEAQRVPWLHNSKSSQLASGTPTLFHVVPPSVDRKIWPPGKRLPRPVAVNTFC